MRTSCEPAPCYPVGLISGPPVALFADLVRDIDGMTGFPIPLPITGKYATFNESYAKAVRNRRCWVCSNAPTQKGVSKASRSMEQTNGRVRRCRIRHQPIAWLGQSTTSVLSQASVFCRDKDLGGIGFLSSTCFMYQVPEHGGLTCRITGETDPRSILEIKPLKSIVGAVSNT